MGDVIQFKPKDNKVKKYDAMDLYGLLQEMVAFREEIQTHPIITKEDYIKALALFRNISEKASTKELKEFSKSYFNHLSIEYEKAFGGGHVS